MRVAYPPYDRDCEFIRTLRAGYSPPEEGNFRHSPFPQVYVIHLNLIT